MNALGDHLLLELRDCNPAILNSLHEIQDAMVTAAVMAKATIIEVAFHEFNPFGISGMVVIAESHLSIHTWPEYAYAAVDIFTCGDLIVPRDAANYLVNRLESNNPSMIEIKRGIFSSDEKKLPHNACSDNINATYIKS